MNARYLRDGRGRWLVQAPVTQALVEDPTRVTVGGRTEIARAITDVAVTDVGVLVTMRIGREPFRGSHGEWLCDQCGTAPALFRQADKRGAPGAVCRACHHRTDLDYLRHVDTP
jgi:hypothetical protein